MQAVDYKCIMNILNHIYVLFNLRCKNERRENCNNVVQSMARSSKLYKKLSIIVHPDKHPDKYELATELMSQVNSNRYNYDELLKLEKRIIEELCN